MNMKRINDFIIRLDIMVRSFFNEEKGDTNFISIIIILAIALVVGALFLGFKQDIVDWVQDQLHDSPFLKK